MVVATAVVTEATAATEVEIDLTATEEVTVLTAAAATDMLSDRMAATEEVTDTAEVTGTEEDTLLDVTMNLVTEARRDENGTADLMEEVMITEEEGVTGITDEMTGGTEGKSPGGMIGTEESEGIERVFPAGRYIFFATLFFVALCLTTDKHGFG